MDYLKRTWADISLDNLNHNYQQLRAKIPSGCRLLGVVKADAYGHGAVPISRHLCELGAEFLAVSNLEEAMQLRRGGIRRPILILGYTPPAYARDLVAMGLRQEVHSLEYARALHEELKGSERRLKVHIKLDTGMSRLGFFAHDHPKTILYPEYALDMVRPGIATYGVLPSEDLRGMIDLRPVMSLRSTIFQIRDFEPNITISYGRTYTTEDPARIAVVGIGYADGFPRSLSSNVSFLLHGRRVPQVGRICMDMCMVDITRVPEAKVGDVVTVFGEDGGDSIELTSLANRLGTIPYELMCGINKRIPRIYLNGEDETEVLQYIV